MSEIDWSKAPCDATHYLPGSDEHCPCWVKFEDEEWRLMQDDGIDKRWDAEYMRASDIECLVKRRKTWTGDGIPSVGTVCEITTNSGHSWRPVEILYVDEFMVLIGQVDGHVNREILKLKDADVEFRPIKTTEQIAAEEREVAIKEMYEVINTQFSFGWVFEKLYDAGYRKPKPE